MNNSDYLDPDGFNGDIRHDDDDDDDDDGGVRQSQVMCGEHAD